MQKCHGEFTPCVDVFKCSSSPLRFHWSSLIVIMLMSSESAVEQHNELNASKVSHQCIKRTTSQSNSEWGEQYEQFCITVIVYVLLYIDCYRLVVLAGNTILEILKKY